MSFSYLVRRLALSAFSLLGVLLFTFVLSHIVPGDPAVVAAGRVPDPQVVERIRKDMGLDKPLYYQLGVYLKKVVLEGDLGRSVVTKRPVSKDLKLYFPATLELVTISLVLISVFGLLAGVVSATRKDTLVDHAIRAITLSGISMPEFWLAIMLQFAVGYVFRLLPVDGRVSVSVLIQSPIRSVTGLHILDSLLQGNWAFLKSSVLHLILPVFTLTYSLMAYVVRISRAAMLDVLNQDYILTARATGVRELKVTYNHALRNAVIPVLTIIGMVYGFLLGGTVLVELIFSWPGIGRYAVNAILSLDFPAIMGVALLGGIVIIGLNFVVDVLCAVVDPIIRYE